MDLDRIGRSRRGLILLCGVMVVAFFALDLLLPLGVCGGVPYVAVVVLTLALRGPGATCLAALAGTLLTALGFFFSRPGSDLWIVLANRFMAVGVIWVTALLVVRHKRAADELRTAHDVLRVEAVQGERVKDALVKSELRFRHLLESTHIVPWEADARTWRFTYVGPQAARLLGYPIERWYEKDFWTAHIHPDDRDSAAAFCTTSAQALNEFEFEYRMIAADGGVIWIHDMVSVVAAAGPPRGLRGFMFDITERKRAEEALRASESALRRSHEEIQSLAGRLLSAQEEESARLARELHDDLTQRVAALAIEAGKVERQIDGAPRAVRKRVGDVKERLVELSDDLHHLSRQLHPSIIDDLGLVDAIESECAHFTEREGITVDFVPRDVPTALPKEIALCLYRVTQESLRNIARHACANNARVTLAGTGDGLHLSIRDTGVGFDTNGARGRAGIGLASMEERVRLIGGGFSVRSRSGEGTTIEVRAPISGRVA